MLHRIFIFVSICFLLFSAGASWCRAEQPDQNADISASRQKAEEKDDKRSHLIKEKTAPHSQRIRRQKSPQSSVYRSHDVSIDSDRHDKDIDEYLDTPAVKLLDKRMPYGDPVPPQPAPKRPRPAPSGSAESKGAGRTVSDLEIAWHLYKKGRYEAAAALFSALLSTPDKKQSLNARLGLAYTRLKQGRKNESRLHFRQLVKKKYRLPEILPVYMELLMESGAYKEVRSYISQLPVKKRAQWKRRVMEAGFVSDFEALPAQFDSRDLSAVVARNQAALNQCIRPDLFFEIARKFHDIHADMHSATISRKLLTCKLPQPLRYGILSLLVDTIPENEGLSMVQREKRIHAAGSIDYLKKLDQLELLILKRRLDTLPEGSDERAETARAILRLSPADLDALTLLAWQKFNAKDYRGAAELFSRLLRMQPDNKAYALGLGYCRLNSGEVDTALQPIEELNIPDDNETLALKKRVYEIKANKAYNNRKWRQAADNFEKVLSIDPQDEDAKQLLAWTRYHQSRYAESRSLMEQTYESNKTPEKAAQLFDIYAGTQAEKEAYGLAEDLSLNSQPGMKNLAADFYFNHRAPVTAAHTANNPDKCYFNASSPRLEAFLYHRNKDGDSGFSELEETALPITAVLPAKVGKIWSFSVTPKYLSSGNAPDQPFAGRYYKFLDGTPQKNDLEDSLYVWQPDIGFEKEGRISTSIHVGSTPFNGAVDPTPTFDLKFSGSKWFVDVHRWNVKDSILSYTGLEDPYGNSEWGRVTRNGITGGYTWPFFSEYWLSGSLGYNFYDGDNLWDNDSYHLDMAVGRTFSPNRDEVSYGLFLSAQHYRRNSDFFTFGHGGYYSPDLMTMVGPFFRYRSALCRDYWFDFQAAVGWLHQKLDGSPYYPRFNGDISGLKPDAAANALGRYDSETKDELGYSFHLQGMKLLNQRLAAGGFLKLEKNTDYTQWHVGVGMQFFFDVQNLFWTRRDFFHDFGSSSNR